MSIYMGSTMSQWEQIQIKALIWMNGTAQSYGQLGVRFTGVSEAQWQVVFAEGSSQYSTDNPNGTGTLTIRGTSVAGANSNLGYARTVEIDINNPGAYGKSGTDRQKWTALLSSVAPGIFYTSSNIAPYQSTVAAGRFTTDPQSFQISAPSGQTFKSGTRMDVYGWANGT